ncbi:MAG: cytochrome c [Burkholderiales bacterium]|nr:MAG: cytochrome c [Burkholderiales bacterium]
MRGAGEPADPTDARLVAQGRAVYAQHCAACHGVNLEGQPNWRVRLPSGRLPAPPHDVSVHTWHHADEVLFDLTRNGLVPGRTAPEGYQSDMPAFSDRLSDAEIWSVIAYIKSTWPPRALQAQREITGRYRAEQGGGG